MGRDKASLPFGDETLLERTVRTVRAAATEIVVVGRPGQDVAGDFRVVSDAGGAQGPMAGLIAGLQAVTAPYAFLTSCDVPFLRAAFVRRMLELAPGFDMVVARIDGYHMVTAAVYAQTCLAPAQALVAANQWRPRLLVEKVRTRIVEASEIEDVDPTLESFRNCNTPEEYEAALRDAGHET